jgi:hypothetical protein
MILEIILDAPPGVLTWGVIVKREISDSDQMQAGYLLFHINQAVLPCHFPSRIYVLRESCLEFDTFFAHDHQLSYRQGLIQVA